MEYNDRKWRREGRNTYLSSRFVVKPVPVRFLNRSSKYSCNPFLLVGSLCRLLTLFLNISNTMTANPKASTLSPSVHPVQPGAPRCSVALYTKSLSWLRVMHPIADVRRRAGEGGGRQGKEEKRGEKGGEKEEECGRNVGEGGRSVC